MWKASLFFPTLLRPNQIHISNFWRGFIIICFYYILHYIFDVFVVFVCIMSSWWLCSHAKLIMQRGMVGGGFTYFMGDGKFWSKSELCSVMMTTWWFWYSRKWLLLCLGCLKSCFGFM